jgi:cardiolipin synthase A/B
MSLIILFLILSAVIIYNKNKPLPDGLSYEGSIHHVSDVEFLYDLTYNKGNGKKETERAIFPRIFKAIDEADDFIVIDMFLFNSYLDEDKNFPKLAKTLTNTLIKKKHKNPNIKIIIITDKINTSYGSHTTKEIDQLRKSGIKIVITKLDPLRDSNPLYSGVWRTFFQWFGQEGKGWLPNPLAKTAPKVTFRSYLELLNIKANHRKVLATEKTAIISSANPHDASGFHSNIAFEVGGNIISDLLVSEQAVLDYSDGEQVPSVKREQKEVGDITVQLLTEGKIYKHLLEDIRNTSEGNKIWIGMFYLADRKVVESIENAADRGVKVYLILDPNENAFGTEKIGLPNLPVAAELEKKDHKNIFIRWYNTGTEQFHTKLIYIEKKGEAVISGGSANFTERNLNDLNLETNIKIVAPSDFDITKEIDHYFNRLWNNEGGQYTVEYREHQDDLPVFKYIAYRLQDFLGFTTY